MPSAKRGSWSHDALYAVLPVRPSFGHPRRLGDIACRPPVDRQNVMAGSRRFPPPWTVEETAPCFIVRDAKG